MCGWAVVLTLFVNVTTTIDKVSDAFNLFIEYSNISLHSIIVFCYIFFHGWDLFLSYIFFFFADEHSS